MQSIHINKCAVDKLLLSNSRFHLQICKLIPAFLQGSIDDEPRRYTGANIDVRLDSVFPIVHQLN